MSDFNDFSQKATLTNSSTPSTEKPPVKDTPSTAPKTASPTQDKGPLITTENKPK